MLTKHFLTSGDFQRQHFPSHKHTMDRNYNLDQLLRPASGGRKPKWLRCVNAPRPGTQQTPTGKYRGSFPSPFTGPGPQSPRGDPSTQCITVVAIQGRHTLKPEPTSTQPSNRLTAAPFCRPCAGFGSLAAYLGSQDKEPMFQEKQITRYSQAREEQAREGVFPLLPDRQSLGEGRAMRLVFWTHPLTHMSRPSCLGSGPGHQL